MKIFSTVIKVTKYGKTNGTPWCTYTDAFGYPRCGIVRGIFGEIEKNTEYNVVIVVDEIKKATYVIPQTKKVCINEESEE